MSQQDWPSNVWFMECQEHPEGRNPQATFIFNRLFNKHCCTKLYKEALFSSAHHLCTSINFLVHRGQLVPGSALCTKVYACAKSPMCMVSANSLDTSSYILSSLSRLFLTHVQYKQLPSCTA